MFLCRGDGDDAADGFEEASKAAVLDSRVQSVQRVSDKDAAAGWWRRHLDPLGHQSVQSSWSVCALVLSVCPSLRRRSRVVLECRVMQHLSELEQGLGSR